MVLVAGNHHECTLSLRDHVSARGNLCLSPTRLLHPDLSGRSNDRTTKCKQNHNLCSIESKNIYLLQRDESTSWLKKDIAHCIERLLIAHTLNVNPLPHHRQSTQSGTGHCPYESISLKLGCPLFHKCPRRLPVVLSEHRYGLHSQ